MERESRVGERAERHAWSTGSEIDENQEAADQAASQRTAQAQIQMKYGGGPALEADETRAAAQDGVAGSGGELPHLDAVQRSFGAGHDVSGIQAHVGGEASEAAQAMGADAYATGNHVAFDGAPDLHTAAHEAAHVVQQRGGVQLKGGVGESGDSYEREADAVADRVVAGESAAPLLAGYAPLGTQKGAEGDSVQRHENLHRDPGTEAEHEDRDAVEGDTGRSAKSKKWKAGAPGDFATAEARHKANLALLDKMLQDGKDEKDSKWGKSWPNACQWLLANKTTLHALTETHDSAARATTLGDATNRAFFGTAAVVPTMSTYNEADQTDATNIELVDPSWLGYRQAGSPSKVVIIDPVTKSKELVQETIVHEVQHDADHHGGGDFDRYQTEFDAYWIDKTYGDKSSKTGSADDTMTADDGTVMAGFDNERQQTIFLHLYNSATYSYVATGWATAAFKASVLALTYPKGINLVNSTRIDDVYLELTKSPPDIGEAKKKVKDLTGHDRAAIVSPAMVGAWRDVVNALPDAGDQDYFKKELAL
jgi:hypothetical protein